MATTTTSPDPHPHATPLPPADARRASKGLLVLGFVVGLALGPVTFFAVAPDASHGSGAIPQPTWATVRDGTWARSLERWWNASAWLPVSLRNAFLETEWLLGVHEDAAVGSATPGWVFVAESLADVDGREHAAARRAFWAAAAARARRLDVALVVVIVPDKSRVYADFAYADRQPPTRRRELFDRGLTELRVADPAAFDLRPDFAARRDTFPAEQLYARTDTHWNASGAALAARRIAGRLTGLSIDLGPPTPQAFELLEQRVTGDLIDPLQGFLTGGLVDEVLRERRELAFAGTPAAGLAAPGLVPAAQPSATIALSGDSFSITCLPALLTATTGRTIDSRHANPGAGPWRSLVDAFADIERGAMAPRVLVHVFAERSLVRADWRDAATAAAAAGRAR